MHGASEARLGQAREVGSALLRNFASVPRRELPRASTAHDDDPRRLDDLTKELVCRMPFDAAALIDVVATSLAGASEAADLDSPQGSLLESIGRLYREANRRVPFRPMRRDGVTILVAADRATEAAALLLEASHLVSRCGLANVAAVLERARSLRSQVVSAKEAARLLTLLPSFRWLSEPGGWFSFHGAGGRLRASLRKVFAVLATAPLEDLCVALGKGEQAFERAPDEVLRCYLEVIAGCSIVDGLVRPPSKLRRARVSDAELALVEWLSDRPEGVAWGGLLGQAPALGLDARAVRRFVNVSPLALLRDGRVRLVGRRPERRAAHGRPCLTSPSAWAG